MDNVIDKLILEWSWRCEKGYPDINNPADKKILEQIIREITAEKNVSEKNFLDTLPLDESDVLSIIQVYNSLNEKDKEVVRENFRKHSLQSFRSFIKSNYTSYEKFFDISKKKGRGRGEFIPLLCIKGSESQGTEDKDIIINGNIVLEIKELDKGRKFLTGKSGSIKKTEFSILIETYCNYLKELGIEDNPSVDFVLGYYETQYVSGNNSNEFIEQIISTVQTVKELKEEDVVEGLDYLKIGDKRFAYSLEDSTKIEPGVSVLIGRELLKPEIALVKIRKHPLIKNSNILYEKYEEVVDKYLSSLDYLGIFKIGGTNPPDIYSTEEIKTKIRKNYISTIQHNLRLQVGD